MSFLTCCSPFKPAKMFVLKVTGESLSSNFATLVALRWFPPISKMVAIMVWSFAVLTIWMSILSIKEDASLKKGPFVGPDNEIEGISNS